MRWRCIFAMQNLKNFPGASPPDPLPGGYRPLDPRPGIPARGRFAAKFIPVSVSPAQVVELELIT